MRHLRSPDTEGVLAEAVENRRAVADRLRELADSYSRRSPAPARLVRMLGDAADELDVTPAQWKQILDRLRDEQGRLPPLDDRRVEGSFHGINSNLIGVAGEMFAAVISEGFVQRGLLVIDLPRAEAILRAAGIRGRELEKFLSKEVDIVFRHGNAWGEVKNHRFMTLDDLFLPTGRSRNTYLEQAQDNARLARAFGKQRHAFFLNGIAPNAANRLRALGIIVHGEQR